MPLRALPAWAHTVTYETPSPSCPSPRQRLEAVVQAMLVESDSDPIVR